MCLIFYLGQELMSDIIWWFWFRPCHKLIVQMLTGLSFQKTLLEMTKSFVTWLTQHRLGSWSLVMMLVRILNASNFRLFQSGSHVVMTDLTISGGHCNTFSDLDSEIVYCNFCSIMLITKVSPALWPLGWNLSNH